jgi:hypothetical protein
MHNMLHNKLVKLFKTPNLYKLKNAHSAKKYVCEESLKNNIKHSKECYYCNGYGWIVWKSNKSNILDLSKQPNIILYTSCSKCQ